MRLDKIIVGVDFGDESREAVAHAMCLARHTGAAITLVHVGTRLDEPRGAKATRDRADHQFMLDQQRDADRDRLDAMCAQLSGHGTAVAALALDGHADGRLAGIAEELDADVLVVGTHGRTGFRRVLLGSVAERSVRLASCAALVARAPTPPEGGYRRILVPTDFSAHADAALAMALGVAAPGAQVDLLHCWSSPMIAMESPVDVISGLLESAEAAGRDLVERVRPTSTATLGFEALMAPAVAGVLDRATDRGPYDIIVMGSHGRRGFRRFMLGSVAEATVRHAPCSVLVVHETTRR